MGLLFDSAFWASRVNEIYSHSPLQTKPMPRESVQRILEIGCKALESLTKDPEFERDLETARKLAEENPKDGNAQAFKNFISMFREAEHKILMNSGTNIDAATALVEELISLAGDLNSTTQHFDRILEKIRLAQELACSGHASIENEIEREALAKDVKRAVGGVAAMGIDGATRAARRSAPSAPAPDCRN